MRKKKNTAEINGRTTDGRFTKGNTSGFQPGQSGNPGGRPQTRDLAQAYREQLAKVFDKDPEGRTFAQIIAETMTLRAARGNVGAAHEIGDRVLGKPRQALDIDLNIRDWRELARAEGIPESEIIEDARREIEAWDSSRNDSEADSGSHSD